MTTAVQRRRGTNTEHASFTGLEGELSVNTTNESVHVHDGSTAGGFELARADASNIVATSIDINGGTIDGTAIGASSASTGAFTTLTASGLTVDTNTLYVNSTNNRVGIGTTSPSRQLEIYDDGTNGQAVLALTAQNTENSRIMFADPDDSNIGILDYNHADDSMRFTVNNSERARLTSDGTFTASPSGGVATLGANGHITSKQSLDVATAGGRYIGSSNRGILGQLRIEQATTGADGGYIDFDTCANGSTSPTNRMRIDSSGNVGIGQSSPSSYYAKDLVVGGGSAEEGITIRGSSSGRSYLMFADGTSGNQQYRGYLSYNHTNDMVEFASAATAHMYLDSSGNLLVGQTSPDNTVNGVRLSGSGTSWFTATSDYPMGLNRQTSDGTLLWFGKNGSSVGSIGTAGGQLYIDGASGDIGLYMGSNNLYPRKNGSLADNAVDIGQSSYRFQDIYATNGTIQTSDRNEKQDIAELSDAEQRVAVAAKGLLRKFRWKDSVAEKGDDARIHFGIIAQDLQAAFEAEGLDAGDYAMFISTTWTDEETNEEKTRMGVRYSELLAFIISAI